jgi:hypothetical protein
VDLSKRDGEVKIEDCGLVGRETHDPCARFPRGSPCADEEAILKMRERVIEEVGMLREEVGAGQ